MEDQSPYSVDAGGSQVLASARAEPITPQRALQAQADYIRIQEDLHDVRKIAQLAHARSEENQDELQTLKQNAGSNRAKKKKKGCCAMM